MAPAAAAPPASILVVDDQPADRLLFRTILGRAGYVVLEAADGAEALALVHSRRPDLVLSDVMMPTLDGYALMRAIRADPRIAATRVVFCTAAYGSDEARHLAAALGAAHFLVKPVVAAALRAVVEAVLGGAAPALPAVPPEEVEGAHLRLLNDQLMAKVAELEKAMAARQRAVEEVARAHAELQALTASIQQVREEERRRIAREIHDELGQTLSALKMDVSWLQGRLLPEQGRLRGKADDMLCVIDGAVGTVRRIAQELRPSVLDTLDIAAAIQWQAVEFRKRQGIRCNISVPGVVPDLPDGVRTHLFRICQELLTNIGRHAEATCVDVTLELVGEALWLRVADNGRGMAAPTAGRPGLGLLGVRERAESMGGSVALLSVPDIRGTRIDVRVPLPAGGAGGSA